MLQGKNHRRAGRPLLISKTRRGGPAVGQHPQQREEVGSALDFVEDDQPMQGAQDQFRIVEAGQIGRRLEIEEVHGLGGFRSQRPGQGGLARLARSDQGDHGIVPQTLANGLEIGGAQDVHTLLF